MEIRFTSARIRKRERSFEGRQISAAQNRGQQTIHRWSLSTCLTVETWSPNSQQQSPQAEARLQNLRRRLEKDTKLKRRYTEVVDNYLEKNYAYK